MSVQVILMGAGGFGHEVIDYLKDIDNVSLVGILDDDLSKLDCFSGKYSILGPINGFRPMPQHRLIVAIANPQHRKRVCDMLSVHQVKYYTLIHPLAYVSTAASVGEGSIVCPFAFIGARAKVGMQAIVNNFASCAHDSNAESFSVLSPYAALNGAATLETGAFLGSKALVAPNCRVGAWSVIGAGATVLKDIPSHVTAFGLPAKVKVA